jgi:hypothetical protein
MKYLPIATLLSFMLMPFSAHALLCFKSGEEISGMNKICYYSCGGSRAAITVASYELCPLSIDRMTDTTSRGLLGLIGINKKPEHQLIGLLIK